MSAVFWQRAISAGRPVDQAVVDAPRVVVTFVSRLQDIAGKRAPQLFEPLSVDACRCRHLVSSVAFAQV